jgi:hypothetical protein
VIGVRSVVRKVAIAADTHLILVVCGRRRDGIVLMQAETCMCMKRGIRGSSYTTSG